MNKDKKQIELETEYIMLLERASFRMIAQLKRVLINAKLDDSIKLTMVHELESIIEGYIDKYEV